MIINNLGGTVEIKNELGRGTQFIISFQTKCKINEVKLRQAMEDLSITSSES